MLEADFVAYLEQRQPKPGFVRYFRDAVLNSWHQKRDVAMLGAIGAQSVVEEVEKKLARLDDLFIDQQAVSKDVYAMRRAKLEEQLVAAKVALHDCETEELDIEAAINFACFLMTNAKSLYTQLSVQQKRRLLAVLSPGVFTFDERSGVRTVTSDCVFNGLYEAATALTKLVRPEGFEPTTLGSEDQLRVLSARSIFHCNIVAFNGLCEENLTLEIAPRCLEMRRNAGIHGDSTAIEIRNWAHKFCSQIVPGLSQVVTDEERTGWNHWYRNLSDSWQNSVFHRFAEAVEVTAVQRGCERRRP